MDMLGGRYRLLDLAGQGGMARVFRAEDVLLERVVAVKVLREDSAGDADFIARFRQEARAAARLSHPNIVAIYDVGEENSRHYIVMEYVEGPCLKEELAMGPVVPLRVVEVGIQVCRGLEYAHQKGIVHRDIKPHNILLRRDLAKIGDFGVARALGAATRTSPGGVLGTPHYISPEQVRGQEATPASDIYSLGVSLYEAVTGSLPFQGDDPIAVALKHVQDAPAPPSRVNGIVPVSLEAIILRAMAKEPQQRFRSAAEMGQALAGCLHRSTENTALLSADALASARASSVRVPSRLPSSGPAPGKQASGIAQPGTTGQRAESGVARKGSPPAQGEAPGPSTSRGSKPTEPRASGRKGLGEWAAAFLKKKGWWPAIPKPRLTMAAALLTIGSLVILPGLTTPASVNIRRPAASATPQPRSQAPAPVSSATPRPGSPTDRVKGFYQLLQQRQFREAYAMFSKRMQSQVTYDNWAKGYANTQSVVVDNARLQAPGPPAVVFVAVKATDRGSKPQCYTGTWTLSLGNEGWLLDAADIVRVNCS